MCYTVPIAAAITTTFLWRKNRSLKMWWLILMFYGGSLFGIIDHLWNNELFLISKNWVKDLGLGFVITAGIFLGWRVVLALAKRNTSLKTYLSISE